MQWLDDLEHWHPVIIWLAKQHTTSDEECTSKASPSSKCPRSMGVIPGLAGVVGSSEDTLTPLLPASKWATLSAALHFNNKIHKTQLGTSSSHLWWTSHIESSHVMLSKMHVSISQDTALYTKQWLHQAAEIGGAWYVVESGATLQKAEAITCCEQPARAEFSISSKVSLSQHTADQHQLQWWHQSRCSCCHQMLSIDHLQHLHDMYGTAAMRRAVTHLCWYDSQLHKDALAYCRHSLLHC